MKFQTDVCIPLEIWLRWTCHDCEGCSACCQGMGNSILLDPMDLWRLQLGKKENFDTLLANYLELNVVDGMVLPNLKMAGEEEACLFLKDGRCSIHGYRPGICRLFPPWTYL